VRPIALGPNALSRFYRGGPAIATFRGVADVAGPEDWVGSTTEAFGSDGLGLTRLPDGRLLRDAIAADPEAFLGSDDGTDPRLLVKLLDAGERLPVHLHPNGEFARRELGSAFGKTEAWLIVATAAPDAVVHVGLSDEVERETLAGWVERQDVAPMLAALNRLPVAPGDSVFVPAGLPHAIGEGILMVEVQEPSDFSIFLEWTGFAIDGARDGHLGLGFERALEAVDRSAWAERVSRLRETRGEVRPGVERLFPQEADRFFRMERLRPSPAVELDPAFSILVVVDGEGELEPGADSPLPVARGSTVLVPYAAGACRLSGELVALRCLPGEA
jgi:mannose-6-phosphate isomerase